jgi:hypothetical protein
VLATSTGCHERWQAPEPPPVNAGFGRYGRRTHDHFLTGEHTRRFQEGGELIDDHVPKLEQEAMLPTFRRFYVCQGPTGGFIDRVSWR